ncbi:MAG TPA: O-antigen ligase family protein, partial [Anaerolineales bacterium]|nr:O-antigen ligase family protein [Anaerolineales bacterium]
LRSLALFMLAAWLVHLYEAGLPPAEGETPRWKTLLKTPIVLPVLLLTAVYLIATLFSVIPAISFFGSYQRLQGTYSLLSYLVIFGGVAANLRRREQIERLITTLVLVSLPVSFYGLLQRNELDPVPWAGNVSRRIAANMGNAIFVAAYLIMVVPLTIGRLIQAYRDILDESRQNIASPFARATGYFVILLLQLTAIYFSRSQGPVLGLLAGLFFLFMVIILRSGIRWLIYSFIGLVGLLGLFLLLLNINNGPLQPLRTLPGLEDFSHFLDLDVPTNRVRVLIWEGASELVSPHDPLEYPDGTADIFNVIRPLVGYGPESMHVVYNRYYPPELGRLENRNASPDRSHNETWDTLVTTGILGLAAYLILFSTIFFYGLKWLGMIQAKRDRYLFFGLFFGGSIASAIGFSLVLGVEFLGVGLPFGAILGMIFYLAVRAIYAPTEGYRSEGEKARSLTLLVLLAGLVGHFVEINFGIAIASTRTYFWLFTGMILVVGYFLPRLGEYESTAPALKSEGAEAREQQNRKRVKQADRRNLPGRKPLGVFLANSAILALILGTLGYDFINAQNDLINPFSTVWASFSSLPNKGGAFSVWVLVLILLVWLLSAMIFTAENSEGTPSLDWRGLGITLGISFGAAFAFWIWHANGLIGLAQSAGSNADILTQASLFEGLLTRYYIYLLFFLLLAARVLPEDWPRRFTAHQRTGWIAAAAGLVMALVLAVFTNLRVIQADITFKLSDPLTQNRQYDQAIALLERTSDLSYGLDHYSLFLGKAYLESASLAENTDSEGELVAQAEESLKDAQESNPLNTDHTANLARLYRWWAGRTNDAELRAERGETSADYYTRALSLSPNNAALWGEWGSLYMTVLGDFDQTFEKLSKGLAVDPFFDGIQVMLGDYYTNLSRTLEDPAEKDAALRNAVDHYTQGIELLKPNSTSASLPRFNYRLALAAAYAGLSEFEQALAVYQSALDDAPTNAEVWRVHEAMAQLYIRMGEIENAIQSANLALSLAPAGQRQRLQEFLTSLQP